MRTTRTRMSMLMRDVDAIECRGIVYRSCPSFGQVARSTHGFNPVGCGEAFEGA